MTGRRLALVLAAGLAALACPAAAEPNFRDDFDGLAPAQQVEALRRYVGEADFRCDVAGRPYFAGGGGARPKWWDVECARADGGGAKAYRVRIEAAEVRVLPCDLMARVAAERGMGRISCFEPVRGETPPPGAKRRPS